MFRITHNLGHLFSKSDDNAPTGRFELFIDLIWVGIIGNLAEHFSDQAFNIDVGPMIARATLEFVILFLLAWRFWKYLQEFMGKYRTNDLVERTFVLWALMLAMLYGNNAPYLLDSEDPSSIAIVFYLVFRASLLAVEAIYSLYLPQIRRRILVQSMLTLPLLGLWIPAIIFPYPARAGLALSAVIAEYWVAALIDTPLVERFLKEDRKELFNTDHWVERIQDFFIIVLGEAVLSLIRGSPLGRGLTRQSTAGALALVAYYVVSCFFFNGDQSRKYVHAVRRKWWRKVLWLL